MRRSLVGLMLVLLLAGCSSSAPTKMESPSVSPGEPSLGSPQISWTGNHPFLPDQDFIFSWSRSSMAGQTAMTEEWVRQEGRIIVLEQGRPIRQWAIGPAGVWAPDPQNPGLMLRFLPPEPQDGLVWHQESEGLWVWFRLRQTASGGNDRWLLTMLNRGQRYDYEFNPPNSLVTWRDGNSVTMGAGSAQPINSVDRAAILGAIPPLPTRLAPVVTADQAAFADALVGLPDQRRIAVDIDGDGQAEQIVGALESWTGSPIDLLSAKGAHLRSIVLGSIARTEVIMVDQEPRLLIDEGGALHVRWFDRHGEQAATSMGPDPFQTPFTSYRQLGDGRLEVVWDPGDAAGHRRIRTLRLQPSGEVALEAERWEAVDGTLRPAATALAALEGLFFTRWYDRPDAEARSYLVNPDDLALVKSLGPIRAGLGTELHFALIPAGSVDCQSERAAEPGPESWGGLSGFVVMEMYPGGAADIILGRASFARAADGRVRIQQLKILKTCHGTH
jgi:hypothetical protein